MSEHVQNVSGRHPSEYPFHDNILHPVDATEQGVCIVLCFQIAMFSMVASAVITNSLQGKAGAIQKEIIVFVRNVVVVPNTVTAMFGRDFGYIGSLEVN